jgi:hypothetical protein
MQKKEFDNGKIKLRTASVQNPNKRMGGETG